MDRACDEKRVRQHLPHSPSLDTRGEGETGATQEHLASNCRGSLIPSITPGGLFRSWPKTDRGGVPLLLPYMPAGITGMMSERVSIEKTIIYYLLTESEVFTGKSQTEALM